MWSGGTNGSEHEVSAEAADTKLAAGLAQKQQRHGRFLVDCLQAGGP